MKICMLAFGHVFTEVGCGLFATFLQPSSESLAMIYHVVLMTIHVYLWLDFHPPKSSEPWLLITC